MSKFVQKTLHSLNAALSNSGMFDTDKDKLPLSSSLDVHSFIVKVKNVTNKQEEEEVILQYFVKMKNRLSEPEVSNAEVEEMVKTCMICETMGYKADFIYFHALKIAQKGNLAQKHIGYLSTAVFLHPNHELVILLVNTLQKDLASSNYLEVILALTAVCHMISHETVGNVMHLVEERLQHPVPSVRKCAVLTFAHCLQLISSKSCYQVALQKMERALSDPDLEVVSVVIPTLSKILKELSGNFSYLIDSLLQLLEQILMWRIPHHLNYSDIPAPWLQIDILKLLKYLCMKTPECTTKLAPILKKILVQTGHYHTVAQAIVFQVIETIASINADPDLLEVAMSSVSLLLKSRDVNMKFMGLESLIMLIKRMEPNITPIQQEIIMDCLKLPDEMLQLKTLELMYYLSNASNVQAICKKMVEFLDHVKLSHQKELTLKILALAEKYHSRHHWYVSIVSAVLSKVDHLIGTAEICKIINVIKKDDDLRLVASEEFLKVVQERKLAASSIIKVLSSVLDEPSEFEPVLELLPSAPDSVVSWVIICFMESVLKCRKITPKCADALKDLERDSSSISILIKQMQKISQNINLLSEYQPYKKIDPTLTDLDAFVLLSFQDSSCCYEPMSYRSLSSHESTYSFNPTLDILPPNTSDSCLSLPSLSYNLLSSPSISFQNPSSEGESFSPLRSKGMWTKDGRSKGRTYFKKENSEEKEESDLLDLFAGIG